MRTPKLMCNLARSSSRSAGCLLMAAIACLAGGCAGLLGPSREVRTPSASLQRSMDTCGVVLGAYFSETNHFMRRLYLDDLLARSDELAEIPLNETSVDSGSPLVGGKLGVASIRARMDVVSVLGIYLRRVSEVVGGGDARPGQDVTVTVHAMTEEPPGTPLMLLAAVPNFGKQSANANAPPYDDYDPLRGDLKDLPQRLEALPRTDVSARQLIQPISALVPLIVDISPGTYNSRKMRDEAYQKLRQVDASFKTALAVIKEDVRARRGELKKLESKVYVARVGNYNSNVARWNRDQRQSALAELERGVQQYELAVLVKPEDLVDAIGKLHGRLIDLAEGTGDQPHRSEQLRDLLRALDDFDGQVARVQAAVAELRELRQSHY